LLFLLHDIVATRTKKKLEKEQISLVFYLHKNVQYLITTAQGIRAKIITKNMTYNQSLTKKVKLIYTF